MNADRRNPGLSRTAMAFFVACFLLVCFFLYMIFRSFFSILIWACVLTVVFQPLFRVVLRATRGRRTAAAFVTCLLILLLIVLPVTILGILIGQQSIALYHAIQASVGNMSEAAAKLQEFQSRPWVRWTINEASKWFGADTVDLQKTAQEILSAVSKFVLSRGPSLLAGAGGIVYTFLMIFITTFFLLRDGPAIMDFIRASNPLPVAYESEIIQKFEDVSFATFFGTILTAIVQGLVAALLFWVLRINSPLFWGAIVAFVSLVPIVGSALVWLPMSAYLIITGHTARGIVLLALGGLVVGSIDNVLKPLIIRGRTDMHPLLVFLSILGGMQVFGFLGVLLGPLVVAIFLTFLNYYRRQFQVGSEQ